MNNNQKYFIQYMLKNGVSTVDDALTYCKYISNDSISLPIHLKSLVSAINVEITRHSFKLVFDVCEVTNEDILVWINTKNDEISTLQTNFSTVELEYFHAILQEILNSDEHRITCIVCLNLTSTLNNTLSRSNGQKVLEKWIKIGYYVKKDEHIYLGSRLILEFNSYLKGHCPDSICNLCSELVFTGKQCASCNKILHTICLSKYLETQKNCPCCHSDWIDLERNTTEENNILSNNIREDHNDIMEETDEVPEDVFESYSQLTEEYSNVNHTYSQTNGNHFTQVSVFAPTLSSTRTSRHFGRLRTRRTTEEDLLEAGPSTRI